MDDVFCSIAKGKIQAKKVLETGSIMVIPDINPKAKIHLLIFPKKHIAESSADQIPQDLLKAIFEATRTVAKRLNLEKTGYRLLTNHGQDAGQTVNHLHFHLLGGEKLKEI